jgi:hypothetical protein
VGAAKRRRAGFVQKSKQDAELTASGGLAVEASDLASSARTQDGVRTKAEDARIHQPPTDGVKTKVSDHLSSGCKSRS